MLDNSSTATDFATVSGVISGAAGSSLTLTGGGTVLLTAANTYSGSTTLTSGNVVVTSIGLSTAGNVATNLGAANGGSVVLNGGTLIYVGPGETTDRLTLAASSTLSAAGSGPLVVTALPNTVAGAKTLTLWGQSQELNTISAILADNAGALTVSKGVASNGWGQDSAAWLFTGVNTFTGNFNLSSGAIFVGAGSNLGTGVLYGSSTNASLSAYNADITLLNSSLQAGNGQFAFTGAYNIGFANPVQLITGGFTLVNTVAPGKAVTFSGSVVLASDGTGSRSLTLNGSGSTVITGVVSNTSSGGTITVSALGGSLTLGGASPNTYTGATTLNYGTLILAKAGALGTSVPTFAFNGGVLQINADLSGANAIGNPVTIGNSQGLGAIITGANSVTFSNSFGTVAGFRSSRTTSRAARS